MNFTNDYAAQAAQPHPSQEMVWTASRLVLALGLVYVILTAIGNVFILTDSVYYRELSDKLTAARIEEVLEMRSKYWWGMFIAPPIMLVIKSTYTTLCIIVGVIIIGEDIRFDKAFKVVLIAESVFVLAMVVQVAFGLFVLEVRVPDDYANFAPLSFLQFFDPATLKLWMKHPLRTLNLFEVAYMLVIAYLLTPLLKKKNYGQTLGLVGASYGLGLLLWVVALAFLLLQVS